MAATKVCAHLGNPYCITTTTMLIGPVPWCARLPGLPGDGSNPKQNQNQIELLSHTTIEDVIKLGPPCSWEVRLNVLAGCVMKGGRAKEIFEFLLCRMPVI